jgi:F0F1-type ATP synthase delta subunit
MFLSMDEYIAELLTRSEVMSFLAEIEGMKEAVYKTGEKSLEQVLRSGVGAKSAGVVLAQLEKSGKLANQEYADKFLGEVVDRLKLMPVVKLELAIDPTREFLTKVRDRITEYIGQQVAVDYQIEPKLMAGMRVAYEGKYFEASLEAKWPEVWAEIKAKLIKT